MFRHFWEQHTHKKYQNVLKVFFMLKMPVDIKVASVDEKIGKYILKLKGFTYRSDFPVLKIMVISNYKDY